MNGPDSSTVPGEVEEGRRGNFGDIAQCDQVSGRLSGRVVRRAQERIELRLMRKLVNM